jgi:hypothetical protein
MSSLALAPRHSLALGGLALSLAGCVTTGPTPAPVASNLATPAPTVATTPAPTPVPTFPRNPAPFVLGETYTQNIDPAMFVGGIDNPFFPMVRGSKFVYDGDEHVEVNVELGGVEILGVYTTIVRDRVFTDGQLAEDTADWYAQDAQGNVWYFGEDTAEYENGQISSTAGSWKAGVDGAQPGVVMLADPQPGDAYRQEYLQGEAEDLAEVTATSGTIESKAGSWSGADVLVTEEWTPLEPKVRERKTYARGVGLVEARMIEGGDEVTKLTSVAIASTAAAPWANPAMVSTATGTFAVAGLGALAAIVRRRRAVVRSRNMEDPRRHEG